MSTVLEVQGRCPLDLQPVILQYEVTKLEHREPTKYHMDSQHCPHCEGSPVRFKLIGSYPHEECVKRFILLYR